MKVTYDAETDTLSVIFKENAAIAESAEDKPGVILDYDAQQDLVSLEILDASRRVQTEPSDSSRSSGKVRFEVPMRAKPFGRPRVAVIQ